MCAYILPAGFREEKIMRIVERVIAVFILIILFAVSMSSVSRGWEAFNVDKKIDATVQILGTYESRGYHGESNYNVVVEYDGDSYTVDSYDVFQAYEKDKNIHVRGIIGLKDGKVAWVKELCVAPD